MLCCDKRNDCHLRQLEKEMRNLFSRAQIILLSLPGSQQVPVTGVRRRIVWYHRRDCDPHHTHAVPLSFIACSRLPLSPKSERIEAVVSCSSRLLFLRVVSSPLKARVGPLLLPPLRSPAGPGLLAVVSARAGCPVPAMPGPCALRGGRLSPAFGFCHLHQRETSMRG